MLFNSPEFVFLFLPTTLILFFIAARFLGRAAAVGTLITAAIVFYSKWEAWHLLVLIPSIVANFCLSWAIIEERRLGRLERSRLIMIAAILANIAVLGVFKYFNFASETIAALAGAEPWHMNLSLPLGISFFTFTQITYLVDGYKGKAEQVSPLRYALFVTYFPHLIAGPILHHSEILPQFERREAYRFDRASFLDGASLFMLGLAKKVMLADPLAVFANNGFATAADGEISLFAAWGAALCYTFQLYFDFSGYSDMALGIARMMRIELPRNFMSPYKATSISEFWRRWHMTLSRFLRDYVYIPLGGNRGGEASRYRNLFLTMLIGGIWHGAGWTFVVWGALHGVYLCINHLFDAVVRGRLPRWTNVPAQALTFLAVVVGWVFFRAGSLDEAFNLLRGMAGMSGAYLPAQITSIASPLSALFGDLGTVPGLADDTILGFVSMSVMLAIASAICFGLRNLYEMSARRRLVLASLVSPFLIQAVLFSRAPSEFIYFQF
jgi:alginate O-acetyltransferase complex protein AlgI